MTQIIIALILAGAAVGAYFVFFRKKEASGTSVGTPSGDYWTGQYGNVTPDPATAAFTFGEPHYIVRAAPALAVGKTISMRFRIDGNAELVPTDSAPPARVRLYIQRAGDNLSGAGPYQQYRYWSHDVAITAAAEYSLSATITPEAWTDVFGAQGSQFPDGFAAALANAALVGFTFGGSFAGHGVTAKNGTANFTLLDWSIT